MMMYIVELVSCNVTMKKKKMMMISFSWESFTPGSSLIFHHIDAYDSEWLSRKTG